MTANLKFAATPKLEVKAEPDGRISGWGSVWDNVDSYGERVIRGAFTKSLAAGALPKMLWQHNQNQPIGRWSKAVEDGRGLYVEGHLNLKTTNGRDAYEHVAAGDIDGMSIGYREVKAKSNGNVRDLLELDLYEVSLVVFPANREASVAAVKSKAELIDMLRSGGLSKQAAALVAGGGWNALSKSNETDPGAVTRFAALIDNASRALKDI